MKNSLAVPKQTKFLVSSRVGFEIDAASEVWHCLHVTGVADNIEVYFIKSRYRSLRGLIAIIFEGDPIMAIRKVREYLVQKPWIMRYSHRIIPVEIVTNSMEELKAYVANTISIRMSDEDSWKINVSKHSSKLSSRKIINNLAKGIEKGKVSLDNPDWIVNVEVIKKTFLAAVIKPQDIIRKKDIHEKMRKAKILEYVK